MFHEQRLQPHLRPNIIIHKTLSEDEERGLRYRAYLKNPYRSWAFKSDAAASPQRYTTEALKVTETLFEEAASSSGNDLPHATIYESKDEVVDYKTWSMVRDNSLIAFTNEEKRTQLTKKSSVISQDPTMWDSQGIELVSPTYKLADLDIAKSTIASLVQSVHTSTSYITTDQTCGLHVHIGLPDDKQMPIKVLQALALLTITYESHLSMLHPLHRSSGSDDINSNKNEKFLAEPGIDARDEIERDGKPYESYAKCFEQVRKLIYEPENASDPYEALALVMGPRTSFINWKRITGGDKAATVEFRQHNGTLDADQISHWVQFCAGLVKLAYKYAAEERQVLPSMTSWSDAVDFAGLIQEMADTDCISNEIATHYTNKFDAAKAEGRDPKEDIWEEKLEDDWNFDSGIDFDQ